MPTISPFEGWTNAQYVSALQVAAARYTTIGAGTKATTCNDLSRKLQLFGRWASERQKSYAEALITQSRLIHSNPSLNDNSSRQDARAARPTVNVSATAMRRIRALFDAAARNSIRRPKIHLRVQIRPETEVVLNLTPAPQSGRHPGCIYITVQSPGHGRYEYAGRITPEGELVRNNVGTNDAVTAAVRMFGEDPIRIARAHGLRTGNCCFCRRELTDARSTAMGYGPICAEHYGLDWGTERASSTVELPTATEILQRESARAIRQTFSVDPLQFRDAVISRPRPVDARAQTLDYTDEDDQFK